MNFKHEKDGNLVNDYKYKTEVVHRNSEDMRNDLVSELEKPLKGLILYDDKFNEKFFQRGIEYFSKNHVSEIIKSDNTYSCTVKGTKYYNVSLKYDELDYELNCECEAFQKSNTCKHIYAFLCKLDSSKIDIIRENAYMVIKRNIDLLKDTKEYIEIEILNFRTIDLNNFDKFRIEYKEYFVEMEEKIKKEKDIIKLVDLLKELFVKTKDLKGIISRFLRDENRVLKIKVSFDY